MPTTQCGSQDYVKPSEVQPKTPARKLTEHDESGRKTLRKRRQLPGSRTVLGAFLITTAGVVAFASSTGWTDNSNAKYLVAAHDMPTGTQLQANDLKTVELTLPTASAASAIRSADVAKGHVLLGPMKANELLQTGLLASKAASDERPQISISIPSSQALAGTLASGERVDVLVAVKDKDVTVARTVVSAARVLKISNASGLDRGGNVTILLSVGDKAETAGLAQAAGQGELSLIRTTGSQN